MMSLQRLKTEVRALMDIEEWGAEEHNDAQLLVVDLYQVVCNAVRFDELDPLQKTFAVLADVNTADRRVIIEALVAEEARDAKKRRAVELRQLLEANDPPEASDVLEAIALARDLIAEEGHADELMGGYEAFDDWAADLADAARGGC